MVSWSVFCGEVGKRSRGRRFAKCGVLGRREAGALALNIGSAHATVGKYTQVFE